jgi:hypothetical protein
VGSKTRVSSCVVVWRKQLNLYEWDINFSRLTNPDADDNWYREDEKERKSRVVKWLSRAACQGLPDTLLRLKNFKLLFSASQMIHSTRKRKVIGHFFFVAATPDQAPINYDDRMLAGTMG